MKTKTLTKTILCCLIFSLFTTIILAQWSWQNPYPTGNGFSSISFIDENVGWIAGGFGTILYTTDGGNTWELKPQAYIYDNIRTIQFIDQNQGWAIGYWMSFDHILHTTDGGNSWELQYTGNLYESIYNIFFTDSLNGWALVEGGIIVNTSDGGTTWAPQENGIYWDLNGIYFIDSNNGWAVGDNGSIVNTSDGGATWTDQTIGTIFDYNQVYFTDQDNGWAMGDEGKLIHTSNGGLEWNYLISGTDEHLYNICFVDQSHGWIAGDHGTILCSNDSGLTWEVQTCPTNQCIKDIHFTDLYSGLAVGYGWLQTSTGGIFWESEYKNITSRFLFDVCFIDTNNGWVAGDSGHVVNTYNGGDTWEEQSIGTDNDLFSIYFTNDDNGWVVGKNGTIMYTTNGGTSWEPQVSGTTLDLAEVFFTDPENGWIVGKESTILLTQNGGEIWEEASVSGNFSLESVYFVDPQNGWAAGWSIIFHTNDGGITWENQFDLDIGFKSIFFIDLNCGWAAGCHEAIYRTIDGGVNWGGVNKTGNQKFTSSLESIYFTDSLNGWAVGWHSGGMFGAPSGDILIHSTDGGINWEWISFPTSHGLYGVAFPDSENGWAVGRNGLIITTSNINFNSHIINVPGDQPTIQVAIDIATHGDTVLVAAGTYYENINFNGKNIVVGSLMLTTGDTSFISQTVINGTQNGSVVTFDSGEDSTAVLFGFTLTNGSGTLHKTNDGINQQHGGGIFLDNGSSPCLLNLVVSGNVVPSANGAGICCCNNNNCRIENVTVIGNDGSGNDPTNDGSGGILLANSSPVLKNVNIINNVGMMAGGLFCNGNSNPILINVTIAGNVASGSPSWSEVAALVCWGEGNPVLINTILWNDSLPEVLLRENSAITIAYSDIQGGLDSIVTFFNDTMFWLNGNINSDPLFADPLNGDYSLQLGSNCIDAGVQDTLIVYNNNLDTLYIPSINYFGNAPDMGANEYVLTTNINAPFITSKDFHLYQNYPNPFSGYTTISFELESDCLADISIYDLTGKKVQTIISNHLQKGKHNIEFDAGRLLNGIYFYQLKTDNNIAGTRKMIVLN